MTHHSPSRFPLSLVAAVACLVSLGACDANAPFDPSLESAAANASSCAAPTSITTQASGNDLLITGIGSLGGQVQQSSYQQNTWYSNGSTTTSTHDTGYAPFTSGTYRKVDFRVRNRCSNGSYSNWSNKITGVTQAGELEW